MLVALCKPSSTTTTSCPRLPPSTTTKTTKETRSLLDSSQISTAGQEPQTVPLTAVQETSSQSPQLSLSKSVKIRVTGALLHHYQRISETLTRVF